MPTHVRKGSGSKPWKIVDPNGKVVGTSKTKRQAEIASSIRNRAVKKK